MSSANNSQTNENGLQFSSAIGFMTDRMKQEFNRWEEKNKKFAPRILLVGPAGVGKSTLVNTMFGLGKQEQAEVRAGGRPCTQAFREYGPFERIPVIIVDSKGIEKENAEDQRDEILEYVRIARNDIDPSGQVHVAWYVPGERWEESDEVYVTKLREVVNVVVVLTKCDLRQQVDPSSGKTGLENTKDEIRKSVPGIQIVETANPPDGSLYGFPDRCPMCGSFEDLSKNIVKGTWCCTADMGDDICGQRGKKEPGPFGYKELLRHTLHSVPELFRNALLVAQVVDMERKNAEASAAIAFHTLAAMGVGLAPIPFSDLPFLLGIEAAMGAVLFNIYDVDPSIVPPETWVKLNGIVAGIIGALGSFTAKLLKMTVLLAPVGAAVDTVVAGLVVSTLGCTISLACQSLPPRSGPQNIDQENFAELLCKTAGEMKFEGLDTLIKAAADAVGLGDKDGDGLVNKLTEIINSGAKEMEADKKNN